jgi:putative protease
MLMFPHGSKKNKIDNSCIQQCEKSASITNLKADTFMITKTKGNYHEVYNATNMLNTEIRKDLPDLFSGFFIDLRDIKTETKIELNKAAIIKLFENHIGGNADSTQQLKHAISPSNNRQYKGGI